MAPDYREPSGHGQRLVLASASPRRIELLQLLSPEFDVVPPDVEEGEASVPADLTTIARRKAEWVSARRTAGIVVAADTGVFRDGQAFGKPRDLVAARNTLRLLSGGWHSVFTGLVVATGGVSRDALVETRVQFKALSDDEIRRYLAREPVLDKAGAYAIQGGAAVFATRIEGDFFNVVGLPLATLYALLLDVGWQPPERWYLFTAETQRTQRKPVLELNPGSPNRQEACPTSKEPSLQDSSANSASLRWIGGTQDMNER